MKTLKEKALELHKLKKGKIEINSKVEINNLYDLSLAYSPGVAEPCKEINENENLVYDYTSKGNIVAVITDGSAVLGLGNIGPKAALPVMEGKSILFKKFANIDSFPLCLDTQDTEEIIKTCKLLSPSLGGINLEDISAPRCIEIERRLINELDIPVFHDDQHGTAIVTVAALINSCRLSGKKIEDLKVCLIGTGAAGSSIARMLKKLGVSKIYANNRSGIVDNSKRKLYSKYLCELLDEKIIDTFDLIEDDKLDFCIKGTDVLVGVSTSNMVTKEMIKSMNKDPFIFAMANPDPEIKPEDAIEAGAYIVGTGRSDYPNQINNVLAFPGIFKGALESKAKVINEDMKFAAAKAIAYILKTNELNKNYIVPDAFDERVVVEVTKAVKNIVLINKEV